MVEEAEEELAQIDGVSLHWAALEHLDDCNISESMACVVGKGVVGRMRSANKPVTAAGAYGDPWTEAGHLSSHSPSATPRERGNFLPVSLSEHTAPRSLRAAGAAAGQALGPTGSAERQAVELYLQLRSRLARGTKERELYRHSQVTSQLRNILSRNRRRGAQPATGAASAVDAGAAVGADAGATKSGAAGEHAVQARREGGSPRGDTGQHLWAQLFPSIDALFVVDVASSTTEAILNRTAVREAAKEFEAGTPSWRPSRLADMVQQVLKRKKREGGEARATPGTLAPAEAEPGGFPASYMAGHITDHCFASNLVANAVRRWWVLDMVLALLGRSVPGGSSSGTAGSAPAKRRRPSRSSTPRRGSTRPPAGKASRHVASHPLLLLLPVGPGAEVRCTAPLVRGPASHQHPPPPQGKSFADLAIAVSKRYSGLCIGLRRVPGLHAGPKPASINFLPYILMGQCWRWPRLRHRPGAEGSAANSPLFCVAPEPTLALRPRDEVYVLIHPGSETFGAFAHDVRLRGPRARGRE